MSLSTENSHLEGGNVSGGGVAMGAVVSFMAERWNVMQTSARIPKLILIGLMESERCVAERRNPRNKRPSKFDQTLTVPTVGSAKNLIIYSCSELGNKVCRTQLLLFS